MGIGWELRTLHWITDFRGSVIHGNIQYFAGQYVWIRESEITLNSKQKAFNSHVSTVNPSLNVPFYICACAGVYFLLYGHPHSHVSTRTHSFITQGKWMSASSEIRLSLLQWWTVTAEWKEGKQFGPKVRLVEDPVNTVTIKFDTHWHTLKSTMTYKQLHTLSNRHWRVRVWNHIVKVTCSLNLTNSYFIKNSVFGSNVDNSCLNSCNSVLLVV